jgi:hypothetical protein
MLDGEAVVTNDRRFYYMVDSFATCRLDFISRVLLGVGALAATRGAKDARIDLLAGIEFRVGHLRVRQLTRRNNPLHRTWCELRVSDVF